MAKPGTSCTADIHCADDQICTKRVCVLAKKTTPAAQPSEPTVAANAKTTPKPLANESQLDPLDVDSVAVGLVANGYANGYALEIGRVRYGAQSGFQLSSVKAKVAFNEAKVYDVESYTAASEEQKNAMFGILGLGQFYRNGGFEGWIPCVSPRDSIRVSKPVRERVSC